MGLSESKIETPASRGYVGNGSIFSAYNQAMKDETNAFARFQQIVAETGDRSAFNPNEVESHPNGNYTIMQAVASDVRIKSSDVRIQFFKYLSSLGFNINCGGVRPVDTVLNILISKQEYDTAIEVIEQFINIISVEKTDGNGHTALHMLFMQKIEAGAPKGSDAYVLGKMLIYYGVPVNYPDFKFRRTALFYGVKSNNAELVEWLLKFSPSMRAGVNFMDVQGFTPLMFAMFNLKDKPSDALNMVKTLCENAPVYVNATNGDFTAMDCFDYWYGLGAVEIRDYLSRKGAVNRSLLKDLAYPIQDVGKLVQVAREIEKMTTHTEPSRVITPARAERPKAQERRDNYGPQGVPGAVRIQQDEGARPGEARHDVLTLNGQKTPFIVRRI